MRRPAILVVDDEPGMLRAVSRILAGRHEVTARASGREALEAALQARFDLAIVDVRMPDINGFELTARLKAQQPDIDVILMTGSVSDLDRKLVRAIREQAFYFIQKPFDREVLETLVERCLDLRRLEAENRRHTARLEAELRAARAFQLGLLPPPEPRLDRLGLACRYRPTAELGGDFYDYASGPAGTSILVADVSGHGVAAAMLTGVVKSAFQAGEGAGPRAVVERIAASLRAFGPQRFVTAFAARIAPDRRALAYVSAGHPPALLWRGDGGGAPLSLASTGLIVSPAFPAAAWREETLALAPGDALLVYTDGVVEAQAGEEAFGHDRLLECLAGGSAGGGGEALDRVLAAVAAFTGPRPPADDLTLVLARIDG